MSYMDIGFLFSMLERGGYGSLAGAIAGAVAALVAFFYPELPRLIKDESICSSDSACNDLLSWVVLITAAGFIIGVFVGGFLGYVGEKIAARIFDPGKERTGKIIGGLIGGVLPWAILVVLSRSS